MPSSWPSRQGTTPAGITATTTTAAAVSSMLTLDDHTLTSRYSSMPTLDTGILYGRPSTWLMNSSNACNG